MQPGRYFQLAGLVRSEAFGLVDGLRLRWAELAQVLRSVQGLIVAIHKRQDR